MLRMQPFPLRGRLLWQVFGLPVILLNLPTLQAAELAGDIDVGGAVRLQYSYLGYDDGNRSRGGDFDLDTIRLNFDGTVNDLLLSAEVR